MTIEIPITGGHVILIDDADRNLAERHVWHAIPARSTFYAQASGLPNLYLHRLLADPAAGQLVDHWNRNGLDNRRENLRLCTQSQNKANMPAPASNTSGYKGVSRHRNKWSACITVDYQQRHLGHYDDPWDAAQAYNAAALDAWGEFALLNHKLPGASPVAHRVPVADLAAGVPEISFQ